MSRSPAVRITAALLGGVAAASALFAVLLVATADERGAGFRSLGHGWGVPLLAGVVVGILSWLLLNESPVDDESRALSGHTLCSACGSPILEDWRLCPYCGTFLGDVEPLQRGATRTDSLS